MGDDRALSTNARNGVNTAAAWSKRAVTICDPSEAVMWTARSQRERFQAILDALEPQAGDLLLDYGCGLGALVEMLPADVNYLGYDWAKGMICRARRDHPDRAFTSCQPAGRFDLVACVGTFNLWENWTKAMTGAVLRYLWFETGCRALACSLYAGSDPSCLVYTLDDCESFAVGKTTDWSGRRWRHNDILFLMARVEERT